MAITSLVLAVIILQIQGNVISGVKPNEGYTLMDKVGNSEATLKVQAAQPCPQLCQCAHHHGDEFVVKCINKTLKTVPVDIPNPTTSLNLNGNELVKLNGENIKHLVSLVSLSISKNNITSVNDKAFEGLSNLAVIDLSHNQIAFIPRMLLNKLIKLQVLNLSNNRLSTIPSVLLFGVSSLHVLNLSHNSLIGLDQNLFAYLQNLKHLDLSFNKLKAMKHDWFQHLHALTTLDLSWNQFSAINNLMFVKMVSLEQIDLSSNNISSLGTVSFKGLVSLKSMDLKNNFIVRLPSKVFSLMSNLQRLDLSNNPFTSLKYSFHNNHQLRFLTLNNLTEIVHISEGSFDSLANLEELSISGNAKLQSIHVNALAPLKNCRYLNLTYNKLESLPRHFLDGLHKLRSISLFENPWVCDCRMFWLFAWLRSLPVPATNFNKHESTFCSKPLRFSNFTVLDALDVIPCRNATITRTTKNTKFKIGSSALLVCNTTGFPKPSVTWLAPNKSSYHLSAAFNSSEELLFNTSTSSARVHILKNGNLFIKKLQGNDAGHYFCTATNVLKNTTKPIHLMLDYTYMTQIEIFSLIVGATLSMVMLLITLIVQFFRTLARRYGWHCCCSTGSVSPKTRQIRKMLDYMEHYKEHQLEKLRENYTQQTQKIRDNCNQQMERLRENYSQQFERLQNICDFGTQQIDKVRDNYNQQVQRIRDYSAGQLDKLRDNYLYQRTRIRDFSANHLYKLRENYKLQQQHLNKIIENFNLDSCRTVCARTESIIFEPELTMETVFRDQISYLPNPLDQFTCEKEQSGDTLSQNSAYFTPHDSMSLAESRGTQTETNIEKDMPDSTAPISSTDATSSLENISLEEHQQCTEPADEDPESHVTVPNIKDNSEAAIEV